MRVYLVGGAVRDRLLGRECGDRDWVVLDADQDEFLAAYPRARPVGRKGITWIWRGEEYTLSEADSIEEDLATRDLTINALAEDEAGRVTAAPGALDDLKAKLLRPVAEANFLADPLRAVRAARLACCFPDFEVTDELIQAMRAVAEQGDLVKMAAERVGMETRKACASAAPGRYLPLLAQGDCLRPWLWELAEGERWRVAAANMEAAPRPDNKEERELLRWMALCAALLPGEAQALGKRLKLTVDLRRAGDTAAETIPRLLDYAALPPEDKAWLLPMLAARNLAPQHFQLARALGGTPALDRAETDLQTALDVKLPPEWRELGRQSGEEILRRRTEALKNEAGEEA